MTFPFISTFEDVYLFPPTSIIGTFRVMCDGTRDEGTIKYIEVQSLAMNEWVHVQTGEMFAACMVYACTAGARQLKDDRVQAYREMMDDASQTRADARSDDAL